MKEEKEMNKEMKLILMNEKTKKKIYIHFKGTRVTIDFKNGTEADIVEVMDDYINNYLKGYWIINKPIIKEIN